MLIITVELCFLMLQALCSAVHKIPFLVGGYFSSRKKKKKNKSKLFAILEMFIQFTESVIRHKKEGIYTSCHQQVTLVMYPGISRDLRKSA